MSVALVRLARRATPDGDAEDPETARCLRRLLEMRIELRRERSAHGDLVAQAAREDKFRGAD